MNRLPSEWSDRASNRVESEFSASLVETVFQDTKANDSYLLHPSSVGRMSAARLQLVEAALSPRDFQILDDLRRLRVLSGGQIERLRFGEIRDSARGRVRRRVLRRLIQLSLVTTLDRRIGGVRAGSAGLIYALSASGQRLLQQGENQRVRNPKTPGVSFLMHALDISEVAVALVERARAAGVVVRELAVESDAVWRSPDRHGQLRALKPDALVVLAHGSVEDVWWLEVDRATESVPRLRAKLDAYRRLVGSGQPVPRGVMPRVLISVPDAKRLREVERLLQRMVTPEGLFQAVLHGDAAGFLVAELLEGEPP